ncbi:MAG: family 43 glycosylhydrolase, partial [Defluviitaleaceae bacterium]|nr:family 43 glycosylhydrolase [Defluviitaleaceae bacterium]
WADYLGSPVQFAAGTYLVLAGTATYTAAGTVTPGRVTYIDEVWIYRADDLDRTNLLTNGDFSDFSAAAIRSEEYTAGASRTAAMHWVLAEESRWSLFSPAHTLVDPNAATGPPERPPVLPPTQPSGFSSPFIIDTYFLENWELYNAQYPSLGEGLRDVRLSNSQEFPDPHMIFHNGNFYVYGTNHMGVVVARSTDNLQTFEHMGLALRSDLEDAAPRWMYWAPEVFYRESTGMFYMHGSSSTIASGGNEFQHRLFVAESDNPLGPFTNKTLLVPPLMGNPSPPGAMHQGWAIDPHMVHRTWDDGGTTHEEYILFFGVHAWSPPAIHDGCTGPNCGAGCNYAQANSRTGASFGRGTSGFNNLFGVQIFMQEFSDPRTPVGAPRLAVWATVREEFNANANMFTVEGPVYFEYEGTGFLMYSGNSWDSPHYFTSYATWDLQGSMMDAEFEKRLQPGPTGWAEDFTTVIGADADSVGMGHHSVVIPDAGPLEGVILMAHHGFPAPDVQAALPYPWRTNVRRLYVTELTINQEHISGHRRDSAGLPPSPTPPSLPLPPGPPPPSQSFPDPTLPIVFFDSARDDFEIQWRWAWGTAWLFTEEVHMGPEFDEWRIDPATLTGDTVIEVYYFGEAPQIGAWWLGDGSGTLINPMAEISELPDGTQPGIARYSVEYMRRRFGVDNFNNLSSLVFWVGHHPNNRMTRIALVEDTFDYQLPEGPEYTAGPPTNGWAARMTYNSLGGGNATDGNFRINSNSLVQGRSYTLFFSYAGADGGTFRAHQFWDQGQQSFTATDEWQAGSFSFTATESFGSMSLGIRRSPGPDGTVIYFANFALFDNETGMWVDNFFPNNGNFPDTGTTSLGAGWTADNRHSITVPAAPPHFDVAGPGPEPEEGDVLRVTSDTINDIQFAVTSFTVEPDTDYIIGMRWKGDYQDLILGLGPWSGPPAYFFVWGPGNTSWHNIATERADDWQEYEIAMYNWWYDVPFNAGTHLVMTGFAGGPAGNVAYIDEVWIRRATDPPGTNLLANGDFSNYSAIRRDEYSPGANRTAVMNWVLETPGRWSLFTPAHTMVVVPPTPPVPVDFSLQIFNNNTDAQVPSLAGTIRMWTRLDGVNAPVPYADLDVTAVLADGTCAMAFVRINRIWNNTDYVNMIDVNKNAPWQTIYLTVALGDQEVALTLINNRFLSATIFEEDWRESINVRFFQGVDPVAALAVPLANITLTIDGETVDNMREYTLNIAAWQTETHAIFLNKELQWQYATLRVEIFGQVWERDFVNSFFVPPVLPVFTLQAFNNGTDTQVPSLAGRIRIWTQLDGVSAPVPYADMLVVATHLDGTCALEFVHMNRMWNNPGYANLFDVNKNAPWQYINLSVTLFGQTVDLLLINNRYVPASHDDLVVLTSDVYAPAYHNEIGDFADFVEYDIAE